MPLTPTTQKNTATAGITRKLLATKVATSVLMLFFYKKEK